MSMCEEPPQRKKSTVDFAGFASVGAGPAGPVLANALGANGSDASVPADAVRKARRSMLGRKSGDAMKGTIRVGE
jgi:hypothetical protein